jgi:hypothetical protein
MVPSEQEHAEQPAGAEVERRPEPAEEEHSARGTFVILIAYLVVIVGLWGTIYLTLLSRG